MFDYSLKEEDRTNYVLKYYVSKDESQIQVEFPKKNGKLRVFNNLKVCPENIRALNKKQEEQVQQALQNENKFKNKQKRQRAFTFLSLTGVALFTGLHFLPGIEFYGTDYGLIPLGMAGIASLKSCCSLVKSTAKVKELEKIKLFEENKETMNSVLDYPNGLVGLDSKVVKKIKTTRGHFNYNNIDEYSKANLVDILSNINTEQKFCFSYDKAKVKTK